MLDAIEHSRILADFDRVCATAGIQGHYLKESMTKYCGEAEVEWVKRFKYYQSEGVPGLVLDGITRPDARCQSIAAALVRNFVDARVVPLNTLIDSMMDGSVVSPTVLLVPNLYVTALSKNMPAWRSQAVYDLLLERSTRSKPTVVYVEDLKSITGVYGVPFKDFLTGFRVVTE